MSKVQEGDLVTVMYDGLLDNGEVFESSADTGPLQFAVGLGTVMNTFEEGVLGMKEGETKDVQVSPADSFGEHKPELVQTIDRSSLGKEIDVQVGLVLGMTIEKDGESHKVPAMVVKIVGDEITLDYNHPLAGKELTYRITVEKIAPPQFPTAAPDGCGSNCGSS